MPTAFLYIRVSTDEQAIKGFSQRSQEDRLMKYCLSNNIEVLEVIFEDYSAKTFNRPAWTLLLSTIKKHKALRPNLILFTKWDRFSRNAGDAYYMIAQLQSFRIYPQAIDQELDLSIPENKIILAVYLATSEAENDRRSLNVKQGIHKAKQEGRWITHPPMGYSYRLFANGQKYIGPKEPEATFVRNAFSLIAQGEQPTCSVFRQMKSEGLKCSNSHFWRMLRNPAYCGKVIVPAFENEKEYWAEGIHEPLIPEVLFLKVQQVLNTRGQKTTTNNNSNEKLILRGFFYCPNCNKRLTGSASKGKTRLYYYYHCVSPCGFRIRADKVHQLFNEQLVMLHADKPYLDLYKDILKHTRRDIFIEQSIIQKTISQSIERLIERILKAKELLLQGEIESDDFLLIKKDCEKRISMMGIELQNAAKKHEIHIKNQYELVLQLSQLSKLMEKSSLPDKRKLLKLILSNNPILTADMWIGNIVNQSVLSVYNLKATTDIKHNADSQKSINTDDAYAAGIIARVAEIENKKGHKTTKTSARNLLSFLLEFARFATANL
ncbi:site-specific DNA recombinase [Chitinophaga sp. W2I13]|uniref:recombinase family protein n=1 Tax=Chitinophaga sp. W2I13 TaxID=3373923 RepID=UPI003D24131C